MTTALSTTPPPDPLPVPPLRPYQVEATDFLTTRPGAMLFLEPGMGKTRVTLLAIRHVHEPGQAILVVCPKVALATWRRETAKYYPPDYYTIDTFTGDQDQRDIAWGHFLENEYFNPNRLRFLVTSYSQLDNVRTLRDNWPILVLDECHAVKNQNTIAFAALKRFRYQRIYLLSGTPASQGPKDLWTYLNLIDPKKFSSFWAYINKYCIVIRSKFGTRIEGPKNPTKIKALLEPYMYRRRKRDVLKEMTKTRPGIEIEMYPQQEALYDQLLEDLIAQVDDGIVFAQNGAVLTVRLRQMLVSPALIGSKAPSAALDALKEKADDLGRPTVIFTAFREAIPLIAAKLGSKYETYQIYGGMTDEALDAQVTAFETSTSRRRALIGTVQMGQSFSITSTSYSITIGPDWSPTNNTQAEDRIFGLGRSNTATNYYIYHKGTVEQTVIDAVANKMHWTELSIDDIRPRKP